MINRQKDRPTDHGTPSVTTGHVYMHRQTCVYWLFSRTTWVRQHQKGKSNLDFDEARDDVVAVASAGPYANNLHHCCIFFTDCMLFLTPNQQCQRTEGVYCEVYTRYILCILYIYIYIYIHCLKNGHLFMF